MALWADPLPTGALTAWAHRGGCGAVVAFAGTTRDHGLAPDGGARTGVTLLEYEAYEVPALDRMAGVATSVLARWPGCGAVVVAHRLGAVPLGEASVLVVVSAPHRDAAFDAARHAIDEVKATVPIWKREHHATGVDWGADATPLRGVGSVQVTGWEAVVRSDAPVADTGGVAHRASPAEGAPLGGAVSSDPDPQERAWAT